MAARSLLQICVLAAAASTVRCEAGESVKDMIEKAANIERSKGSELERVSSLCKVVPNSAGPNKTMDTLLCPGGAFPKGNSRVPAACTEQADGTLLCNSALMTGPAPNRLTDEEYAALAGRPEDAPATADEIAEELAEQEAEAEGDGAKPPGQLVKSCKNDKMDEDLQCVDLQHYLRKSSGIGPNDGEKQESLDACTEWTGQGGKWKQDFDQDCGEGDSKDDSKGFECPDGYDYQDQISTDKMCAAEGEVNHGGPGWGGDTDEESTASCAKECDSRKGCTDFVWYSDKGCRTYTNCDKQVDQSYGIQSYICKKEAGAGGTFKIEPGSCRKEGGKDSFKETEGHSAATAKGVNSAEDCKKELKKRRKQDPTFNSAEWSGDDRGMCWMHKTPKAYKGNGDEPYQCISFEEPAAEGEEQFWHGWYLMDYVKCPCSAAAAPPENLEREEDGLMSWFGSTPKKTPSFIKGPVKPISTDPCPSTDCPDCSYKGKIYGRKKFTDGTCMKTSKVADDQSSKGYIQTKSGSKYFLWKIDGWKKASDGRITGSLKGRPGMSGQMTTSPAQEFKCLATSDAKGYMKTRSGSYYILGSSKEQIPGCTEDKGFLSKLAGMVPSVPKISAPSMPKISAPSMPKISMPKLGGWV